MTITIRKATPEDAKGIAHVHVTGWQATYAGIVPDEYLQSLSAERRAGGWRRMLSEGNSFTFVAVTDTGEVVGFVDGGPEREHDPVYTGELYAIYLLKEAQGQGTGRQLVSVLAQKLVEAGLNSMLLWVLAKNPSRGFYEALGGQFVRSKPIEISGVQLEEIAYGWQDVGVLL